MRRGQGGGEVDATVQAGTGATPFLIFKVVGSGVDLPSTNPFQQTLPLTATSVSVCPPKD